MLNHGTNGRGGTQGCSAYHLVKFCGDTVLAKFKIHEVRVNTTDESLGLNYLHFLQLSRATTAMSQDESSMPTMMTWLVGCCTLLWFLKSWLFDETHDSSSRLALSQPRSEPKRAYCAVMLVLQNNRLERALYDEIVASKWYVFTAHANCITLHDPSDTDYFY